MFLESFFSEISKCLVFLDEQKHRKKINVIWQILFIYLNTVLFSVISCGDPGPVTSGIYVGNDFTYNHTVVYHCNPGHLMEPAGQGTLRCTKEGAWNQTKPSCKGKSSQSPAGQIAASFSLSLWWKPWFGASWASIEWVFVTTNPHIHLIKNALHIHNIFLITSVHCCYCGNGAQGTL